MKRAFALLAVLLAPLAARAQFDAETDKPYELQIVLRCGLHNWLGKQFRDDLRGNLSGMLADALGPAAVVSVIDLKDTAPNEWQPLWKEVDSKGFGALDAAQELTGVKTHFLRVNFVEGQYELQARQFDGKTGMVSPWRRERTPDRAFVARLAGNMIAEDFGVIATVAGRGGSSSEGEAAINVRFKAAALGGQMARWVKPGDVFAVFRVAPGRGGAKDRAVRELDTLVRITGVPKNGEAAAKLYHRAPDRDNPLQKAAANLGFRCIKLGTSAGPMRLRLVDDKGQPHTRTLQVRVHSQAFQRTLAPDEEVLNPDRGGLFVSRKSYDQVAFARVVTGANQIARVPVPILDGGEYRTVVGLDAQQEQAGQLQALRGELRRLYEEAIDVQLNGNREVTALVNKTLNDKALARATAARRALEDDLTRLATMKEDVRKQLVGTAITVDDCDKLEVTLQRYKDQINRLIGRLEETERQRNAPDKVERRLKLLEQNNKVHVLIDSDDYDGAIALLRQLIKEYADEPALKKQLDDLEKSWEIRSDAHRQARDFIYREWTAVKTSADIEAKMPIARQKFQVVVQVGDQLTLLKLRNSLPEIGKVLRNEITALAQNNPDDTEKSAKLKKLVEDFDKFGQEIETALKAKPR